MHRLTQTLAGPQRGPKFAAFATPSRVRLAALSVLAALSSAAPALAQIEGDYYFETLPFPEPSYAYDTNNDGLAVVYVFSTAPSTPAQTFLWDHGVSTDVKFPGSTVTQGYAINEKGAVFGRYWLGTPGVDSSMGFRRDSDGVYTSIEFPGAFSTEVQGANNNGDIVGIYYMDPSFPIPQSYMRDKADNFAPVVVPFAEAIFGGIFVIALGVNGQGEISGIYFDNSFNFHGFIRDKNGAFTEVVNPNTPAGDCTGVDRINSRGSVVGTIWTNGCFQEAGSFIRSGDGSIVDVPFPPALDGGSVLSINDRGDLSGYAFPSWTTGGQAMIAWRL